MKALLLAGLLLAARPAPAQRATEPAQPRPAVTAPRTDTMRVRLPATQLSARAESSYVSILEKTNQQLSMWTNPYGLMVGALGVLFTLLAIVATVVIFLQSASFRKQVEGQYVVFEKQARQQLDGFQSAVDALVAESKTKITVVIEEVRAQLVEAREQLKKELAESQGAVESDLAKHIERLERVERSLTASIAPTLPVAGSIGPTGPASSFRFRRAGPTGPSGPFDASVPQSVAGLLGGRRIRCPDCNSTSFTLDNQPLGSNCKCANCGSENAQVIDP
jgi:hypothetical protein